MQSKIQVMDEVTISYSKSSIEVFPVITSLSNASSLYFKFSRNYIKTQELQQHSKLFMDFDLCLIDSKMDETVIQLFAIFEITSDTTPVNNQHYVEQAVDFARSLIATEIERQGLRDGTGAMITVPETISNPEVYRNSFNN